MWIDDEPRRIAPLLKGLRRAGCLVEVVEKGAAGLECARQGIHEVIILDWKLPDLGGAAVLERICRDVPDVPIVVLTGHGNDDVKRLSRLLGAAAYRTKPIRLAELLRTLEAEARGRTGVSRKPGSKQGADHPTPFVSPSIQRLAQAIVDAASLKEDPRTFKLWARVPGVTEDGLHRLCELLGLEGRAVLRFTRLLRAATLIEHHDVRLTEVLDIAEPKTMARLLAKAGLVHGGAPRTVADFIARQTLVRCEPLTRAVSTSLSPSPRS